MDSNTLWTEFLQGLIGILVPAALAVIGLVVKKGFEWVNCQNLTGWKKFLAQHAESVVVKVQETVVRESMKSIEKDSDGGTTVTKAEWQAICAMAKETAEREMQEVVKAAPSALMPVLSAMIPTLIESALSKYKAGGVIPLPTTAQPVTGSLPE